MTEEREIAIGNNEDLSDSVERHALFLNSNTLNLTTMKDENKEILAFYSLAIVLTVLLVTVLLIKIGVIS